MYAPFKDHKESNIWNLLKNVVGLIINKQRIVSGGAHHAAARVPIITAAAVLL